MGFCLFGALSFEGSSPRLGGLVAWGLGRHADSTCRECLLEQIAHHNTQKQKRARNWPGSHNPLRGYLPRDLKMFHKALPSGSSLLEVLSWGPSLKSMVFRDTQHLYTAVVFDNLTGFSVCSINYGEGSFVPLSTTFHCVLSFLAGLCLMVLEGSAIRWCTLLLAVSS